MFSDIYARLLRNLIERQYSSKGQGVQAGAHTLNASTSFNGVNRFSDLIQHAYQLDEKTDLGLQFGKQLMPVSACEFSRMLTSVATVRDFFTTLVAQYHRLGLKPYPIWFEDGAYACIALTYPYQRMSMRAGFSRSKRRSLNRFCSESFYAYCVNVLRSLVDESIHPDYMAFDYPAPDYRQQYVNFFRCPVEFNAGLSLIRFPRSVLARPLTSANPYLHQAYMDRFSEQWHDARREQRCDYRAVTLMMLNAPHCFQIGQLAERMNISVRGLQKRLKNENSSFSELTQQVRRELLKICLVKSDQSLEDSAYLLGFQTLASFKRFFREQMEQVDDIELG